MIPFKEITTTFSILSLKKYMHQAELMHLFIFPKGTYSSLGLYTKSTNQICMGDRRNKKLCTEFVVII